MEGQGLVEQAVSGATAGDVAELRRQLEEATGRVTALEGREAVLLAAQARREVTDALSAMRFGELEQALTPAARTAFVEALMPLDAAQRTAVVEAVKAQQFVSLGERGFVPAEEAAGEALSASEEAQIRSLSERNGLAFEEVRAQFLEVRKRRTG